MNSPTLREHAQQLIDLEMSAGNPSPENDEVKAMLRVCEKLRRCLSASAGVAGFSSLMARSLTLAKAELPWMEAAKVDENGTLVLEGDPQLDRDQAAQGGVLIIACLIGLLVDFIGGDLTLSLIHEAWPQAGAFSKEEKNP